MSQSPVIRYSGVLNPVGRRLLNVCFEPLEELFELHKEVPVELRIQVPEDNEVFYEPPNLAYEDD